MTLHLTDEEQALLAGEAGAGVKKAMQIVVALGEIYGAADLVPIDSAQVSGVSFRNLGEAGLELLNDWAAQGARTRRPAFLNPAGMDLVAWQELGFPAEFARRQQAVIAAYAALGVEKTCTCTPYQCGNAPEFGRHLAWAESSALCYANSVLGARTNREGGPSALAAAITGRTARCGLHLDENRLATTLVEVRCPLTTKADWGALGLLVGQKLRQGVPFFRLAYFRPELPRARRPRTMDGSRVEDRLKALGAAMAASGAVAMFHLEGITPEEAESPLYGLPKLKVESLDEGYASVDGKADKIDVVSLGCPHASVAELAEVASMLEGKRVRSALWITTARATREAAAHAGLVAQIEAAGGRVVADTCMVVAPVKELGFRTLATDSAKMAFYAPSHCGLAARFGTTEQCIEAALLRRWPA